MDFHETLSQAIQKGYYFDTKKGKPLEYIKFNSFGSQSCKATVFDKDGDLTGEKTIRTEERHHYELVPGDKLPEKLKTQEGELVKNCEPKIPIVLPHSGITLRH